MHGRQSVQLFVDFMSDIYQKHDGEAADHLFEALDRILEVPDVCSFTCSCSSKEIIK